MKTIRIIKSVATTTALGVLLAGCSGGPESSSTANRSIVNPSTSSGSGSTTPTINPITSGGTGTIGGTTTTGTSATSGTADNSINAKLDQILAQSTSANSNAKSAKNKANIGMIIGASLAGLAALAITKGTIDNMKAMPKDEKGKFFKALWSGATFDRSRVNKKIASEAANEAGKKTTENVNEHSTGISNAWNGKFDSYAKNEAGALQGIKASADNASSAATISAVASIGTLAQQGEIKKQLEAMRKENETNFGNVADQLDVVDSRLKDVQNTTTATNEVVFGIKQTLLPQIEAQKNAIKSLNDKLLEATKNDTVNAQTIVNLKQKVNQMTDEKTEFLAGLKKAVENNMISPQALSTITDAYKNAIESLNKNLTAIAARLQKLESSGVAAGSHPGAASNGILPNGVPVYLAPNPQSGS